MMHRFYLSIVTAALILVIGATNVLAAPNSSFIALCFHNVEDENPDQSVEGVTTSKLIAQLSWLQHEGYQAVSVDDLLAARAGKKPLPEKAMLLTFDDGYESFYTRVYPILRTFHYPAVLALVDTWMKDKEDKANHPGDHMVLFGDKPMPRDFFLTWDQVREMDKSGLVEIASHSHDLHLGVPANPQGNVEPSAITPFYDPATNSYETAEAYKARLDADAEQSAQEIAKKIGHRPRVIVWPYGAYNQVAIAVEQAHGMPVTLTLDDGFANLDKLAAIPRYLQTHDPDLSDFVIDMRGMGKPAPLRVVQVDLDYVYDPDPEQLARNLDNLITRIYNMQISTVFLQGFADPTGSGLAKELYFPNHYLPMRADLFNRVAWQLRTRAHVKVYGWLPVLSYDFGDTVSSVLTWNPETGNAELDPKGYRRASPFDPQARRKILGIYEDMARQAPVDGLLFHDDAMLSDFEDASEPAIAAYMRAGFSSSIEDIRSDPDSMSKWTAFKTDALIEFTKELADRVRLYRSPITTVRNIYAPLILNPESEEWFAQNYDRFLQAYDYTAVMAMPQMENVPAGEENGWMQRLVANVSERPNGLKHTIFELQAVDWREAADGNDRAIPTEQLGAQMQFLLRHGALNFGYYPDDFVTDTPNADMLHKDFSLQNYPYRP